MQLPIQTTLNSGVTVELDYMHSHEQETVRALLNHFVSEGMTYPQAQPLSQDEFKAYWMSRDAFVVRAIDRSLEECRSGEGHSGENSVGDGTTKKPIRILGAFYLKPNFPGRCSHICNAGFIVQPEIRGQGIGRYMGEAMLAIARAKGYRAVMFNLVFETNIASLRLWQSLGFTTIGRIPNAAQLGDGQTVDALMLYYSLEEKINDKG
jgi:ribosomal protein S18 acetylase RimI-like enzyme